jgi:hypothetical protein
MLPVDPRQPHGLASAALGSAEGETRGLICRFEHNSLPGGVYGNVHSMRRALPMIALLLCCCGLPTPAGSQSVTLNGVARSHSASYFMRTVCPKFFQVNVAFATKYGSDMLEFGAVTFGKPELKEAVTKEIARRRTEVGATGESAWCSYQRSSMMGDGLNDLFR